MVKPVMPLSNFKSVAIEKQILFFQTATYDVNFEKENPFTSCDVDILNKMARWWHKKETCRVAEWKFSWVYFMYKF